MSEIKPQDAQIEEQSEQKKPIDDTLTEENKPTQDTPAKENNLTEDKKATQDKKASKKKANRILFKFSLILCAIAMATVLLSGVIVGFVANRKVGYEAEYADKVSFYQASGFDLQVRGATVAQVEQLRELSSVSNAIAMSRYKINATKGTQVVDCDVALFNSLADLQFTEFTTDRIVAEKSFAGDAVFVDYRFCQLNNVSLGDALTFRIGGKDKQVTISRIYRTDYLFSEGVLVATRDVLTLAETSAVNVYLTTDNKTALVNYLQDYKPEGTIVAKTEYQTDEQYQQYLDEFYAKQYYNSYVTDLSVDGKDVDGYLTKISSSATVFYVVVALVGIVSLGVSLFTFFIKAKNKKDQIYRYIQDHGNKTVFCIYTVFNVAFALLMFVCMLVVAAIIHAVLFVYSSLATILLSILPALLIPAVAVMAGYAVVATKIKRA